MNYVKLKTSQINLETSTHGATKRQIKQGLMWIHRNYAFSVYAYCGKKGEGTSKKMIKQTGTGNCIALSYGLQELLYKKYGVKSYLIPATVPEHIQKPGYLDISHVALMIPSKKKWVFYVADPAFYFVDPIKVNLKKWNIPGIFSMCDIYKRDSGDNCDFYHSRVKIIEEDYKLNKYQTILKDTPMIVCSKSMGWQYNSFGFSDWNYFITEIKNPDAAISGFFMKVWQDKPFITRTAVEKKRVVIKISIHHHSNSTITIKERNNVVYEGRPEDLSPQQIRSLDKTFAIKKMRLPKFEKMLFKTQKSRNSDRCVFSV